MPKKPLIVFLTGGLGNQLFQLSNALSLDLEREIRLSGFLGNHAVMRQICQTLQVFSYQIGSV